MKKVCFVILCHQDMKKRADIYKGFSHKINMMIHQWQDYYSLTSGYDCQNGFAGWEQCIIYSDNNRIISTDYKPVKQGQRNDILLSSHRESTEDIMLGLVVEALELARRYEYENAEMILHIVCDSPKIFGMVMEAGLVGQLLMSTLEMKRYEHIFVDFVIEETDGDKENMEFRKEFYKQLKRIQKEHKEFQFYGIDNCEKG